MSKEKQIIIDIDADGNCYIKGEGFVGPECAHFMEEVEEAIGVRVTQSDLPEYHQRSVSTDMNRQLGRE